MKNKSIYAFLACVFLLSGCGTVPDKPESMLKMPEKKIRPAEKFSEIAESYRLVPLETNEECLIGNLRKIVKYDHKYYISTLFGGELLIFDEEGRFLRKLSRRGNGPGEYAMLTDFDVCGDRIVILDGLNIAAYTNDERMDPLGKTEVDFVPWSIRCLSPTRYCVYVARQEEFFFVVNEKGKILHRGGPFKQASRLGKSIPFLQFPDGRIRVQYGFSNDWVCYDPETDAFSVEKLFPGGYILSSDEEEAYIQQHGSNYSRLVKVNLVGRPALYGRQILMSVRDNGEDFCYVGDLETQNIRYRFDKNTENDLFCLPPESFLLSSTDCMNPDGFTANCHPLRLHQALSKFSPESSAYRNLDGFLKEHYGEEIREDENPVLIEVRFKK